MLSKKIKEYFDRCVKSDYSGLSQNHPIILLNAIKNIIGDNRKEHSKKLLDFMENKSKELPKRDSDQTILDDIAKEGIGLTVFVSDLEDACQSGIPEKIEKEAARLQWVSDNGLGGFETLIEVVTSPYDELEQYEHFANRSPNWAKNLEISCSS